MRPPISSYRHRELLRLPVIALNIQDSNREYLEPIMIPQVLLVHDPVLVNEIRERLPWDIAEKYNQCLKKTSKTMEVWLLLEKS